MSEGERASGERSRLVDVLLAEQNRLDDLFTESENLGERRLTQLVTLISALAAGLGLVINTSELTRVGLAALVAVATGVMSSFSVFTLRRLARRNIATDHYERERQAVHQSLARLTDAGGWFRSDPAHTDPKPVRLAPTHPLGKAGGVLETVLLLASITLGAFVASAFALIERLHWAWLIPLGLAGAMAGWTVLRAVVGYWYRTDDYNRVRPMDDHFRASVGIVVRRPDGRVLCLERSDRPRSWQFPQGGIQPGESVEVAGLRELHEETGIGPAEVEVVTSFGRWLTYELPVEMRSRKTGRGQTQMWLLVEARTEPLEVDLGTGADAEFRSWEWRDFEQAVADVVDFRRPVYEALRAEWGPQATPAG